ncbi:MAG: hypothetical protein OXI49_01105 [Acidobacteriota bacterium]|nr:hypothetical protein [Acidobacteriota bacterium]
MEEADVTIDNMGRIVADLNTEILELREWHIRVDERMKHVAMKEDLANLRVWMMATTLTVGALIVAAIKLIP